MSSQVTTRSRRAPARCTRSLHLLAVGLLALVSSGTPPSQSGGVRITIENPRPGDPWLPERPVSLSVDVTAGALADAVRADPAAFEVCYSAGYERHCYSLLASLATKTVAVAPPSPDLTELRAWLQRAAAPGVELPGTADSVYLWQHPERAAGALRRKLAAALLQLAEGQGGPRSVPAAAAAAAAATADTAGTAGTADTAGTAGGVAATATAALLREHLDRAMGDKVTVVASSLGQYALRVGFGTYGLENAYVHFWGSPNASLTIGRFCSIATGAEFFLDGNHRLDAPSTYPFVERGAELGFGLDLGLPAAGDGNGDGDGDSDDGINVSGDKPTASASALPAAMTQNTGKGPVVLGSDVWVGRGAVFLSGVTVGTGAVVGTRAVVTKDVPPYGVVAGNPARLVRQRFGAGTVARLLASRWWEGGHEKVGALAARLVRGEPVDAFLDFVEGLEGLPEEEGGLLQKEGLSC